MRYYQYIMITITAKIHTINHLKEKTLPILKSNDVSFAGIFGSYARGEQNDKSDVDLLVRFVKPKSLLALAHLERLLSEKLGRKVDLVTENALSPYIKDKILSELVTIYGRR